MNLNDLEAIFWGDQREQPARVRLARVVKALRDNFGNIMDPYDDWNREGILSVFDDILKETKNEG